MRHATPCPAVLSAPTRRPPGRGCRTVRCRAQLARLTRRGV